MTEFQGTGEVPRALPKGLSLCHISALAAAGSSHKPRCTTRLRMHYRAKMDDFLYCFHAGCTTVGTEVKLKGACKHIAVEQGRGGSSVLSAQATGLASFYIGEKYSVS